MLTQLKQPITARHVPYTIGFRSIRMYRYVYDSHVMASRTFVTVPETISAFRWSGMALMKLDSIGICPRDRYQVHHFLDHWGLTPAIFAHTRQPGAHLVGEHPDVMIDTIVGGDEHTLARRVELSNSQQECQHTRYRHNNRKYLADDPSYLRTSGSTEDLTNIQHAQVDEASLLW